MTHVSLMSMRPELRIEHNPYDVDAWILLVRDNHKKHIDSVRDFYESLVVQFPNAGRFWRAYVEHELRFKNYENVEKLFTRCLVKVLNVDLWKCYLQYVRDTKASLPTFREKMAQAYDFALDKVGLDVQAYQIYADYASFIRQVQASGSYQEFQKISAVRKVYHRGVCTPMQNIEQLWAEYCNFEKSVNAHLAEKLIAEKNRDFQAAKRVHKQLQAVATALNKQAISVPPTGSAVEQKQVQAWKKYVQLEKENPLQTEDQSLLSRRISYAYEQALLCLGYHTDVWYEAGLYMQEAQAKHAERGDVKLANKIAEDVAALYERACSTLMRDCALLHFAYADYEEGRMKYQKVHTIYQRYIDQQQLDPTLCYIQQMKFARRTEGIKAARAVFKRARDDQRTSYHAYIAAAKMEFYCSKEPEVATRIFDLGLKKYGHEPDYVLACVDFRTNMNDDNNTRVLFERILTSGQLVGDKSLDVWDRYLEFECRVGDLTSICKVDQRRREAVSSELRARPTLLMIDRCRLLDLLPCTPQQLHALGYKSEQHHRSHHQAGSSEYNGAGLTNGVDHGASSSNAPDHSAGGGRAGHQFAQPDTAQMIPFKPKIVAGSTAHPISGGVFAPPPAVSHLMTLLPPPWCFNGPFVGVNSLIDRLRDFRLPDSEPTPTGLDESSARMNEIKKEMYTMLTNTPDPIQLLRPDTRKRTHGGGSDDEGSEHSSQLAAAAGPSHDVYRMRQHKRNR